MRHLIVLIFIALAVGAWFAKTNADQVRAAALEKAEAADRLLFDRATYAPSGAVQIESVPSSARAFSELEGDRAVIAETVRLVAAQCGTVEGRLTAITRGQSCDEVADLAIETLSLHFQADAPQNPIMAFISSYMPDFREWIPFALSCIGAVGSSYLAYLRKR